MEPISRRRTLEKSKYTVANHYEQGIRVLDKSEKMGSGSTDNGATAV